MENARGGCSQQRLPPANSDQIRRVSSSHPPTTHPDGQCIIYDVRTVGTDPDIFPPRSGKLLLTSLRRRSTPLSGPPDSNGASCPHSLHHDVGFHPPYAQLRTPIYGLVHLYLVVAMGIVTPHSTLWLAPPSVRTTRYSMDWPKPHHRGVSLGRSRRDQELGLSVCEI